MGFEYFYMGIIAIYKYCPYKYIYDMAVSSHHLKSITKNLADLLKQAGYHPHRPSFNGEFASLRGADFRVRFDFVWKPHLSDAAIANLVSVSSSGQQTILVAATEVLSRSMFERCKKSRLSVLDTNSNGIIRAPGFSYERYVEPSRTGRPKISGTPFSMKASRLVRTFLADHFRTWAQSELVRETAVTQGYTSIKLKALLGSGYLANAGGKLRLIDPERLLDDWASHYRFDRHVQHRFAFNANSYEDGLKRLAELLDASGIDYAFTGWSAGYLLAPYGIPPKWMTFVRKLPDNPDDLGLFPVEQGENALLIVPQDRGVLQCRQKIREMQVVSTAQAYIDLLKMPGRAREQALALREKYLQSAKETHDQT